MEWGGASLALVNPAPPEPERPAADSAPPPLPLPRDPLLYAVRVAPGGGALALPVAALGARGPAPLGLPESLDGAYRDRFDAVFLVPGRELALYAGGSRAGSLVLGDERVSLGAGCPSAARATPLLPPGTAAPALAFALPLAAAGPPVPYAGAEPDGRMRTWAPILAERILRAAGETRPWLARLASLSSVRLPDGEEPALAATYLIGDSLGAASLEGDALSLFFLAAPVPAGYEPAWSIIRRYGRAAEREAYAYLDAIPFGSGRFDLLFRHDAGPPRLAASRAGGDRRSIDWVESERCPSASLLEEAAGG